MPRPTLPPTPGSSTDISGRDGSKHLAALQIAFELPPPAVAATSSDKSHISPVGSDSPQQHRTPGNANYPVQPAEAVKSRRRSSAAQLAPAKDAFALPPPPMRSRRIIQMKPRTASQDETKESTLPSNAAAIAMPESPDDSPQKSAAAATVASTTSSKRKQPSATSAAGRKMARKTAHSLIERRRRSKMNEEFAVLKNMIPACTGEMHKLAILQASIEYVRYLEDCICQLKSQQQTTSPRAPGESLPKAFEPSSRLASYNDPSEDVDMTGSELPSPTSTVNPARQPNQPSVSPALVAQDARHRNGSYSSNSTEHHRHYSYSTSAATSPAFGPQQFSGGGYPPSNPPSAPGSTLTSPALLPQRDHLDHEATTALLMLNSDRRGTGGSSSARADGRRFDGFMW